MKVEASRSSDGATLETKYYDFYYGYERCYCPAHKHLGLQPLGGCADDDDGECATEWCFVVEDNKGKLLFWLPDSKLGDDINDPGHGLILGIGHFLNAKISRAR